MSLVALIGSLTLAMRPATLERLLGPLVAMAAGTMLGGALFHMIPNAMPSLKPLHASAWLAGGFTVFLALEQVLHWHQARKDTVSHRAPATYLILIGDTLHNFLGGLAIASTFLVSPHAGVVAWLAAVAHEVPQELGDFGVLVQGGWSRRSALRWNFLSALSFPAGALIAYYVSRQYSVAGLALFGAGNFIYIASSELVPKIKAQKSLKAATWHFGLFVLSLALTYILAAWLHD